MVFAQHVADVPTAHSQNSLNIVSFILTLIRINVWSRNVHPKFYT